MCPTIFWAFLQYSIVNSNPCRFIVIFMWYWWFQQHILYFSLCTVNASPPPSMRARHEYKSHCFEPKDNYNVRKWYAICLGTVCGINFTDFMMYTLESRGIKIQSPPWNHAVTAKATDLRRQTNVFVNNMASTVYGINFNLFGPTYPRVCERRAPLKSRREGKRNRFETSDKCFRKWHAKHYLWYKFQPFRAHIP